MRALDMKLTEIDRDDAFDFSYPYCPQRCVETKEKFPGLPLLIVDKEQRLVWGHDHFRFLLGQGSECTAALMGDFAPAEALFLNFNLSNHLFGLNLREKLLFVRKASIYCRPAEIQRRVNLGFNLNDELFQHLQGVLHASMGPPLASGQLSLNAALRLMDFSVSDRRVLLKLFSQIKFSESHQLLVAQLLEETVFREKKPLSRLVAAMPLADLLGQEMPQQKIVAAIRRLRFPELSRCEDEWRQWEKARSIPGRVALTHAPLFAKEEIQIFLTAKNRREADELLKKLK